MMRLTVAVLLTLGVSVSFSRSPKTPMATTDWVPSSVPAMELAKRCDHVLHELKLTSMSYSVVFDLDNVGRGQMEGKCAVKDPTQYHVEMPVIGENELEGLKRETIISKSGKLITEVVDPRLATRKVSVVPTSHPKSLPANLVSDWYRGSIRDLLMGVGGGVNPLEALVKQASANQEFRVKAETRVLDFKGRPIRSYRIVAERRQEAAKRKGDLRYEVVIGDKFFYPLTLNNIHRVGRRAYYTRMYDTRWNPNPNQKFSASLFKLGPYKKSL